MSKVYLYTARATTAEKVQFDKKDTSVIHIFPNAQDDLGQIGLPTLFGTSFQALSHSVILST